jgi:hypothetical protein
MVQPKEHDTYKAKAKPSGAMVCDTCSVVFHGGRWFWGSPPLTDEHGGLCPACKRIRDRYPAGTIRLDASFLEHRKEVLRMIARVEEVEKEEHPLERLMGVEESDDGITLTTTGIHLARRITNKLERRFHKQARIRYPEEQNLIFVDLKG